MAGAPWRVCCSYSKRQQGGVALWLPGTARPAESFSPRTRQQPAFRPLGSELLEGPQVPRSPSTLPKSATNTAVFCFTRPGPGVRPRVSVQLPNCPQKQTEQFGNVPQVTQEPAPATTPAQTRSTIMAADILSHCTRIISLTPHNDGRKEESLPLFCRDSMTPEAT